MSPTVASELEFRTFADVLRSQADRHPKAPALTFLTDGDETEETASYGELDRRARAIAARLQAIARPGDRVLLLSAPGLELVAALFGCLYAAMTAVPVYPPGPTPARLKRTLPRLLRIVRDCEAGALLADDAMRGLAPSLKEMAPELEKLAWVDAGDGSGGAEEGYRRPDDDEEGSALLQYTSGSTARPRGVMVTNRNLLVNSAFIHRAFGHSPKSQGVIWLPPYHDMGLIGGILQPIYGGFPCTLLSPLAFLQRPIRWLRAITRSRATTSGGPNFAYELCLRRVPPRERESLDLSTWQVAFNGSEPVRSATLDAFARAFAPSGFRPEAFHPCYGLAEATLAVTVAAGGKRAAPVVRSYLAQDLERGRATPAPKSTSGSRELVSCGRPDPGHDLQVVDTGTRKPCRPGTIGEIWLAGPSVASGYWKLEDETRDAFRARLDTGEGPFLRTGDLGFLDEGELFVTGRLKDLLVVRGRNFDPTEIEDAAARAHEAIRPNGCAAFLVEGEKEPRLVLACEIFPRHAADSTAVILAVRRSVGAEIDLQVDTVVLLGARALPKTSSGKIQRSLCRRHFLEERLEPLARWSLDAASPRE